MKSSTSIKVVAVISGLLFVSTSVIAKAPLEGEPDWEQQIAEQQKKAQQEKEKLELRIKLQEEQKSEKESEPKEQ